MRRQEGSTGIHPWGVCGVTTSAGADPRSWLPLPAHPASHLSLLVLAVHLPALAMHVRPKPSPINLLRKGKQSFLWASVAAALAGGGGQGRAEELKRQTGQK